MIAVQNLSADSGGHSHCLGLRLDRLIRVSQGYIYPDIVRRLVAATLMVSLAIPVATAGEQIANSASSVQNPDQDGLESRLEVALGTNPRSSDMDGEFARIDIAIDDENLTVTKQPNGSFRAEIALWNRGSRPLPRFLVFFYAGDPDDGGRLLATHGAGPIAPGDAWVEYNPGLKLRRGEDTISVVVDPGNRVDESDETNNKASQVIPGRQKRPKTESAEVDIAIGERDLVVTKLSDRLIEAVIPIRNRSSVPLPRFHVYFYAGDREKGGRLLSHPSQSAGPIMPGDSWLEAIHPHRLEPGEDMVSVVLDPDNRVEESDETNNKASQNLSEIISESEQVIRVGAMPKLDLSSNEILQVEARASEGFNFPYYLFIPGGIDKDSPIYMLVESNNSGMVSDDPEVHQAKALTLVKRSHANQMARRLGVPLLVPTFPRPQPETHSWAYTHALDIDTLEIEEGTLKRIDLQLTAMIEHAQELLRTNGFKVNNKVFMHGFSASAKFCNRYSYLHPEMVKAAAAGGVNGLPTLPVREWSGHELPFPIGLAGIEKFIGKPFDEKAFMQVAHYIYMGSSDRNDTLLSREAWREEEAAIIKTALAAEKMMPDRWELSREIYRQQKLHAQLVTYDGVGHSIESQMLDDVIDFFTANAGEKYVPIEPHEHPPASVKGIRREDRTESTRNDIAIADRDLRVIKLPDGLFIAWIAIHNKGVAPSPKFRVYFYAGDPDKGGRLLVAPHGAGPIMPGDVWREGTYPFSLAPGESTISVVVDPDNKVEESDETNNKASRTISTIVRAEAAERRVSKAPEDAVDIAIEDGNLMVREVRGGAFRAEIMIHNGGSSTIPRFRVNFFAGDPDEDGRLLATHGAGPIAPGEAWVEYNPGLKLGRGEDTISVVVDPDNRVQESNEKNNKASQTIPGRRR